MPDSRCRLPAPPLARAQLPQQGMPVTSKAIAPYSPALARRSVAILTTESAPKELNATMTNTSAGAQVVVGTTPLQPALVPSWHPRELQQAHTPLRSSTFEQELRNHPNKFKPGSHGCYLALTTVFPPDIMDLVFPTQHVT